MGLGFNVLHWDFSRFGWRNEFFRFESYHTLYASSDLPRNFFFFWCDMYFWTSCILVRFFFFLLPYVHIYRSLYVWYTSYFRLQLWNPFSFFFNIPINTFYHYIVFLAIYTITILIPKSLFFNNNFCSSCYIFLFLFIFYISCFHFYARSNTFVLKNYVLLQWFPGCVLTSSQIVHNSATINFSTDVYPDFFSLFGECYLP